jgi:predicted double-glycine peptidase
MSYFIKQIMSKDCGFTCLKMLLATKRKNENYLYLDQDCADKPYTYEDLIEIAKNEGCTLKAFKLTTKDEIFEAKNLPLMVTFAQDKKLHMVLLTKINKKSVEINDPANGEIQISKEEFLERFNGDFLECEEIDKRKYKAKKFEYFRNKHLWIALFMEFISFVLLVCGLYFSSGANIIIPVLLFSGFILTSFIYRRVLTAGMKDFDKNIIEPCYSRRKKDLKTVLLNMTMFKKNYFVLPIELLSSILILIFGSTLLAFNSVISLTNIVIITLCELVLYLLFNKKINAKKAKIQEKEGVLNENKNEQLVKKAMDEATSEAYSISNFNDSKRYIIIFLILIMTLIYMYLSNQISINFLIFHFFFYSFLDESIVKIIDYIDSINEYRFHKCLYLNYCKEE